MLRGKLLLATIFAAVLVPACAGACDGPGGNAVAVSCDGMKCTVTNTSRAILSVAFAAWGLDYQLQLGPQQSGIPVSTGLFSAPMKQYQTCVATVIPSR